MTEPVQIPVTTTVNAGAVQKVERQVPQRFVVLDVETTGLEEEARLLELGLFVMRYVDDGKAMGWVVDSVVHRVFYYKPHPEHPLPMFEAHLTNGLAEECERATEHPWSCDEEFAALVPEKSIPIGRNVHFDIKALQKHMPALAARFHYRHLDLTSLEMGAEPYDEHEVIKGGKPARAKSTHRALQDCIQELMALRDLAFMPRKDLRDKGPSA